MAGKNTRVLLPSPEREVLRNAKGSRANTGEGNGSADTGRSVIDLDAIAQVLSNRPETLLGALPWKFDIDLENGVITFYQLNLNPVVPRVTRGLRIRRSALSNTRLLRLVPSVFVDNVSLGPDFIPKIIDGDCVQSFSDVVKLLGRLNEVALPTVDVLQILQPSLPPQPAAVSPLDTCLPIGSNGSTSQISVDNFREARPAASACDFSMETQPEPPTPSGADFVGAMMQKLEKHFPLSEQLSSTSIIPGTVPQATIPLKRPSKVKRGESGVLPLKDRQGSNKRSRPSPPRNPSTVPKATVEQKESVRNLKLPESNGPSRSISPVSEQSSGDRRHRSGSEAGSEKSAMASLKKPRKIFDSDTDDSDTPAERQNQAKQRFADALTRRPGSQPKHAKTDLPVIPFLFRSENLPSEQKASRQEIISNSNIWVDKNRFEDIYIFGAIRTKIRYARTLIFRCLLTSSEMLRIYDAKILNCDIAHCLGSSTIEGLFRHFEEYRLLRHADAPSDAEWRGPVNEEHMMRELQKVFATYLETIETMLRADAFMRYVLENDEYIKFAVDTTEIPESES